MAGVSTTIVEEDSQVSSPCGIEAQAVPGNEPEKEKENKEKMPGKVHGGFRSKHNPGGGR